MMKKISSPSMLAIADYAWKTIGAKPPGWPNTTTDAIQRPKQVVNAGGQEQTITSKRPRHFDCPANNAHMEQARAEAKTKSDLQAASWTCFGLRQWLSLAQSEKKAIQMNTLFAKKTAQPSWPNQKQIAKKQATFIVKICCGSDSLPRSPYSSENS